MSEYGGKPIENKLAEADRPAGAIGYVDEMSQEQLAGKHVDGSTGLVFDTEEAYLSHVSPVSGHRPTEMAHQDKVTGGQASRVAEKAQERGAERAEGTDVEEA